MTIATCIGHDAFDNIYCRSYQPVQPKETGNRHLFCAVVNTTSDVLKGFRMIIGSKPTRTQINALTQLPLVHFEPFIVEMKMDTSPPSPTIKKKNKKKK